MAILLSARGRVEIKLYHYLCNPSELYCTGPFHVNGQCSTTSVTNKQTLAKQEPIYFHSKTEKPTAPRIISAILHHGFETENIGSCICVVFAAIPVVFKKRRKATWCWLAQVAQEWKLSFHTMFQRVYKKKKRDPIIRTKLQLKPVTTYIELFISVFDTWWFLKQIAVS